MKYHKEYCIYCRYNGGFPFILKTFNSFEAAKIKLLEMIELEEERERPYFVENNFFQNKYIGNIRGKHFSIKEREVSEWNLSDENKKLTNNNIICFDEIINKYRIN